MRLAVRSGMPRTFAACTLGSPAKKRNLIITVWLLPVAGAFIALYLINRDIKKNQAKIEKDIAPAIRELADRIRNLEADIQREEKKQKLH